VAARWMEIKLKHLKAFLRTNLNLTRE